MEYIRITDINDPLFAQMHQLMKSIFPPEEVLEFSLWKEPLEDPGIRVFVAVLDGRVVGATEYRYYEDFNIAIDRFYDHWRSRTWELADFWRTKDCRIYKR